MDWKQFNSKKQRSATSLIARFMLLGLWENYFGLESGEGNIFVSYQLSGPV